MIEGDAATERERHVGGARPGQGGEEVGEPCGPRVQEHHPHTAGETRITLSLNESRLPLFMFYSLVYLKGELKYMALNVSEFAKGQ